MRHLFIVAYRPFLSHANSTSKCKITKCFCKSTPLVLRYSISLTLNYEPKARLDKECTTTIAHHRPFSMSQKSFYVLFKPLFYHIIYIPYL